MSLPHYPLLPSKLAPPPLPRRSIARARLLARLDEGERLRLTLLIAPAGYGKTTLLAQWVAQRDADRIAWYTLEETEDDLVAFLTYLTEALAPAIPEAAAQARDLLALPQSQPADALALLLSGLHGNREALVLILDDVHQIAASAEALAALDRLLRHAPPTLRLILSARQEPPLPTIPRLRAMGQVLELGEGDLRFAPDEVVALVDATLHLTLDADLASQLTARTEGWAVALQLACQTGLHHGPAEAERLLRRFGGTTRQLYDYLARVVLAGQPEERRVFLRRTSILDRLEPALCDALLERDDTTAILEDLERSSLFLFPLDAARSAYRYHPLFREFLQRRLQEVEGSQAVRQIHRRAAAWYLEQADDEQAIMHLLAAEDWDAAADLIYPLQNRLFPTSRYHLLERWLDQFPPAFADAHPWLLLSRAKLAALRGERDLARQLYRRAEPLLHAQEDRAGLHDLYHDLGGIAQDQGNFALAQDLYTQALAYAPQDPQRAVLLGQIARCLYMQGGQVQEALDLMDQAVALAERSGDLLGQAGLFSLQGRMRSSVGDLQGALDAFYTALNLLGAFGNHHRQVGMLCNIAYHHSLLGQLDQAEAVARRAIDLASTFNRATGRDYALNILGEVHRRRGEYDQARACHREALIRQRRRAEQYEVAATLNWLGVLARHTGDGAEALRRGQEGLDLREKLGNDYEIGLSLIDLGATYLALGRFEEAEAHWRRALGIFEAANARYEQTHLYFYLAVLAQQRGDAEGEALLSNLNRALALAPTFEWGDPPRCLHFFIEEAAWTAPLLADALRRGVDAPCLDCLLPRLGRPALTALLPLLDDEAASVRARAATLLGRLADAEALQPLARLRHDADPEVRRAARGALSALLAVPPPPLRVQTLGRFRLWRGDEEITRWPRRSARDVFLLLLEQAPRPLSRERLMEWLWPDSRPDKAAQSLRRAVADLRRTLEPELPSGFPARYVVTGEETYALHLPEGSWVDSDAFEEALDRARRLTGAEAVAALEEALALYEGEYLPELPYTDWVLFRREQLRGRYLTGLLTLGLRYREVGRQREAEEAARRVLAQDPWNEEATLLLMQACQALGDVAAALRAYESLRERLQRDLGLTPCRELTALYRHLRQR